jgi:hypothetical protein
MPNINAHRFKLKQRFCVDGPDDQLGAYCRMWEVVDMAELEPGECDANVVVCMTWCSCVGLLCC